MTDINKKAQGEIITTILIILLVLALIVIVWYVVEQTNKDKLINKTNESKFTCPENETCGNTTGYFRFANESEMKDLYSNQLMFGNPNQEVYNSALTISDKNGETMKIYTNGSFWIKNGTEKYNGEQLAKVAIAYSSYINGFCNGIKQ